MKPSARNQIKGEVVDDLGSRVGDEATAVLKASDVIVAK